MKVVLGVTGSVAATLAPKIVKAFQDRGHTLQVILTKGATYFLPQWACGVPHYEEGDNEGHSYDKEDPIFHVEIGKWADVFVVAPLTANTLAKMANGICDNLLTSTYRALPPRVSVVLAPAMNTNMWNHPVTQRNLAALPKYHLLSPTEKRLACGDEGIGAMADIAEIVRTAEEYWKAS